jgi:hypothetical protein
VASWVGKPIGVERGKHLYAAFSKNGETARRPPVRRGAALLRAALSVAWRYRCAWASVSSSGPARCNQRSARSVVTRPQGCRSVRGEGRGVSD